jgi:glucosamine kinase
VPQIFAAADAGDGHAQDLLHQTAADIGLMVRRLTALSSGPVALMGGLATPIQRWLDDDIQARLVTPQGDALSGALILAQQLTPARLPI